jgi:hypothetical protein
MINPIYEISSTNYFDDKLIINNALSDLAAQCGLLNEFDFGQPTSRFGWTFFKVLIKPHFHLQIEQKFGDMIKKSKGTKFEEKCTNFLSDYFQSKGCKIKVKLVES